MTIENHLDDIRRHQREPQQRTEVPALDPLLHRGLFGRTSFSEKLVKGRMRRLSTPTASNAAQVARVS